MNSPASLPLFQSRVVPVIVVTDPAQAVPMAEALLAGGVDVIVLDNMAGDSFALADVITYIG